MGTRAEIAVISSSVHSVYYIRQYNNVKSLGTAKRMLDGVETDMTISGQMALSRPKALNLTLPYILCRDDALRRMQFTDIRYTKLKNPYLDVDAEEGNPLTNVPKAQLLPTAAMSSIKVHSRDWDLTIH